MLLSKSKLARRLLATTLLSFPASPFAWGDNFTWEPGAITTNWDNALNWAGTPNAFPDDNTDSALVDSTNAAPTLIANRTIGSLTIRSGGDVFTGNGTNNFALTVQESLSQNGRVLIENAGSSLTVRQSPMANDLDTDELLINSGGRLTVRDGARVQIDQSAVLNVGGEITGNGIIEFNFSGNFANDGVLRANTGGSLTLTSSGIVTTDLDGVHENGMVIADSESQLIVSTGATSGPFDGSMFLFSNSQIQINTGFQFSNSSLLSFDGGAGTATLSGPSYTIGGNVVVQSGTAVFEAITFFGANTNLTLAQGATIQFDEFTILPNPDGFVNEFDTTIVVNDQVQVGTGSGDFDWDGPAQAMGVSADTVINPGGSLKIHVGRIDAPGFIELYSGTLTMNSGELEVQNMAGEWDLGGTVLLNNATGTIPTIKGADVTVLGDITVSGTGASAIEANATFGETSNVQVQGGAWLDLGTSAASSQTVLAGGTFTGAGRVNLDASLTTVSAATSVNMPNGIFDLDGTFLVDQLVLNAPLTMNVQAMDLGNSMDDDLRINSGGRLTINLTNPNFSYDIAASLELNGQGGAFTTQHLAGSAVRLVGNTQVTGNSATSARTEIVGQMNIAGAGTFQIRGGTASNPSWVRAGATVTGAGDLVVSSTGPGYLRLEDGASVGVELVNRGSVDLGPTAANATVSAYTQTATGTYIASIDGLSSDSQYDQLVVNGAAVVDGTLEIELNPFGGTYVDPNTPGTFDEFELILAGSVSGTFDEFIYDGSTMSLSFSGSGQDRFHAGSGLFRVLDYDATEVDLLNYRALMGDANGDGSVDGSDFGIWNSNKFTVGTDWTTGDFNGDGVTDGTDFGIWNSNKFSQVALGRPALFGLQAVPEPGAFGWSILFVAASLACRYKKGTGRAF